MELTLVILWELKEYLLKSSRRKLLVKCSDVTINIDSLILHCAKISAYSEGLAVGSQVTATGINDTFYWRNCPVRKVLTAVGCSV